MWTKIYVLVVLISLGVATNYCGEEYHENDNCNCISSPEDIEIQCPQGFFQEIIVRFHKITQDVTIEGMDDNLQSYENVTLPHFNASSAEYLHIKYCPDINVSKVVDYFQMKSIKTFKLESLRNKERDPNILNADYFKSLKDVEHLVISDFYSLTLEHDFLKYTTNIKTLNLNRNKLDQIDYYFTNEFSSNIEYINLSDNQITSVPENVFRNLSKVQRLELWHNNLTSLTANSFNGLENLKMLELSYNHIRKVDADAFSTLKNLEALSLKYNNLQKVPADAFKNNKMLEKIRLDFNPELELSDYLFSNLTNLREINLSNSNLRQLPEHLFKGSSNILEIIAYNNNLEILAGSIFEDLTRLRRLDLSRNKLTALPNFSTLAKLNVLILNANSLKEIPSKAFSGLQKLNKLDLSKNEIVNIQFHAFLPLENLTHLDLSFNQLTLPLNEIDVTPLNDCLAVKKLSLDHNRITRFPDELLTVLVELRYFNISYNPITDPIRVTPFSKVVGAEIVVDVSNTKIDRLDFENLNQTAWIAETQAKINLLENEGTTPASTRLFLNNTKVSCNCSNYGLLLYNAGYFPNLQKLLKIDQRGLKCTGSARKVVDLEPGYCAYSVDSCPEKCSCNYRPFNRSLNVDCSYRNLTKYPRLNITVEWYHRYNHSTIDLSGNSLTSAPDDSSYSNVTWMNLANNSITHISYVPPHIQEIHLEHNRLKHLNKSFIDRLTNITELKKITLKGNPWVCDCDARHLQHFLQQKYSKVDGSDVRCHKDNALLSKALNLCPQSLLLLVVLPVCLGVLLLFSVAFAIYYRYEEEILIFLFIKGWLCIKVEVDKDKKYDAFISFSHEDTEFAESVVNELESGEPKYKVCIHTRDWPPGEYIQNQVIRSVQESRTTLIVLTNDFLNSVWGKYEFKMAHTEAINEGISRVIVIIKGEINEENLDEDMKNYLKTNTYVKWGEKYFWQKLKYAISHIPRQGFKRKSKKSERKHQNMMLKIDDKFQLVHTPSPTNTSTPPLTLDPGLLKSKQFDGEEPLFAVHKTQV